MICYLVDDGCELLALTQSGKYEEALNFKNEHDREEIIKHIAENINIAHTALLFLLSNK